MNRFIDVLGDVHTIDQGGNHFINGKLVNPKSYESRDIGDTLNEYVVEPYPLAVGHVPSFEYGYGDNKVIVNTGQTAW